MMLSIPTTKPCACISKPAVSAVTPRTAENWLAGLNAPRAAELIRLMAANDDVAAEVLGLVEECRCEAS
ncbi:MAG: hypothetical protein JWO24_1499 [Rhodospirillales bacterium]|jgi:hypothetical protein|nr:hypothetical protein [Rhodospirillales bacterium]